MIFPVYRALILFVTLIGFAVAQYTDFYETTLDVPTGTLNSAIVSTDHSGAIIYVAGQNAVYSSVDYGSEWSILSYAPVGPFNGIVVNGTGQFVALLASNVLSVSIDLGLTWTARFEFNWESQVLDIACSGSGEYFLATVAQNNQYILVSNNWGYSWSNVSTLFAPNSELSDIGISSTGQYMLVIDSTYNMLYQSRDFGVTWAPSTLHIDSYSSCLSVGSISASGEQLVVTDSCNSVTWMSSNYGQTWSFAAPTGSWMAVSASGSGQYILASTSSAVFSSSSADQPQLVLSTDGGKFWNVAFNITIASYEFYFASTCISSSGQYQLAGVNQNALIYYSINYGITWAEASNMAVSGSFLSVNSLASSATSNVSFAAIAGLGVYRSVSYGESWSPVYSLDISWDAIACSDNGQLVVAASIQTENMISLVSGYVYMSADGGNNWNVVKDVTVGSTNVDISMACSGQVISLSSYTDYEVSVVWISSDYGSTWEKLNSIPLNSYFSAIAVNADASQLFAGDSVGNIYESTNLGATWKQTPVATTYYAVNSLAVSDDASLVIAAIQDNMPIFTDGNWQATTAEYQFEEIAMASEASNILVGISYNTLYVSNSTGAFWFLATITSSLMPNSEFDWFSVSANADGTALLAYSKNANSVYSTNPSASSHPPSASPTRQPTNPTAQPTAVPTHPTAVPTAQPTSTQAVFYLTRAYYEWITGPIASSQSGAVLMVATIDGIYVSSNYGSNWITYTPENLGNNFMTLDIDNSGQIAVLSTASTIFVSQDYGATWPESLVAAEDHSWLSASISGDGTYIVAVPYSGALYVSTSYGASWSVLYNPAYASWEGFAMSNTAQYMIAASDDADVYLSSDYGSSWSIASVSTETDCMQSTTMSSDGQYIAGVDCGTGLIWQSSDYGSTWKSSPFILTTDDIFSSETELTDYLMAPDSPNIQIALTAVREIYLSFDYGQTWEKAVVFGGRADDDVATEWFAMATNGAGSYIIAASGADYALYSTNYDSSIAVPTAMPSTRPTAAPTVHQPTNPTAAPSSSPTNYGTIVYKTGAPSNEMNGPIAISGSGEIIVCATTDGIIMSKDGGLEWQSKGDLQDQDMVGVSMNYTGELIAVASSSKVYVSIDSGSSWNPVLTAANMWIGVCVSGSGGYIIALPYSDEIYMSTDQGTTWTELYNEDTGYLGFALSATGQYMLLSVVGYGLLLSSDYGSTWTQAVSAATQYVTVSSSGQYMVATEYEGLHVWQSSDFGQTWTESEFAISSTDDVLIPYSFISFVVPSQAPNVQVAIMQSHVMYVSYDYGSNWNEMLISDSNENLNTYWFVAAADANGKTIIAESSYDYSLYSTQQFTFTAPTKSPVQSAQVVAATETLSPGKIAGIVIGSIGGLAMIVTIVYYSISIKALNSAITVPLAATNSFTSGSSTTASMVHTHSVSNATNEIINPFVPSSSNVGDIL